MNKRYPTNASKDSAIFTRTAQSVKSINLPVKIYRGGIRL